MSTASSPVETWRPVVGFEDRYEVSDLGRVRSLDMVVGAVFGNTAVRRGRVLRWLVDQDGYHRCALTKTGQRPTSRGVHQLVCEAFVGPRPGRAYEVRHLDGDPKNNTPTNLAWGTRRHNADDRGRHGRHMRGTRNSKAKLTEVQARLVIDSEWNDRTLAAHLDVSVSTIADIRAWRTWSHLRFELP